MRRGKGKKATGGADSAPIPEWAEPMNGSHVDEVEELLRVAQDDVFLRLNVNSHRLHSSSSGLDADLDRRFAALKVPSAQKPNPSAACNESEEKRGQIGDGKSGDVFGAELSARFLALKGPMKGEADVAMKQPMDSLSVAAGNGCGEDEDFDSEVQKLLEWAKDAARLDSSRSDEEDEGSDGDDDDDDDESDDDRAESKMKVEVGKKEKRKQ
ncbi:uncharacterized protein LOC116261602 [Nymphaea colorata]|uniref:uncharacterized protein LOC116261602 n=1 Tax=Nymphaea colorata TaxID=210225 RepID=UPI00129D51F6|nr:uncharacterized protein LOC116261602 [Nymphaea colorata]